MQHKDQPPSPHAQAMGTPRAWAAWFVVVAGVLAAAGTTHETSNRVARQMTQGEYPRTVGAVVDAVRVYLTDEADEYRYVSYVNAVLGRPYQPYYVRRLTAWNAQQLRENAPVDNDAPLITPARPLVPYRDFLVEYPIGFFLWALPPALVASDVDGYRLAFNLWMAALASAAMLLAVRLARRPPFVVSGGPLVAWAAGSAFALGVILTHRYDAAVGLLLMATVYSTIARRPVWTGLALGLAVVSKGVPILVAPGLAMWYWGQNRRRELAVATAACAAVGVAGVGLTLALGGSAAFDSATYHAGRPLQLESTMAAWWSLLHRDTLEVVQSHGSFNIIGFGTDIAASVTNVFNAVALLGSYFAIARLVSGKADTGPRATERPASSEMLLLIAMVLPLVVFMVTAKVFSPQYLVWLMPVGLLAAAGRSRGSVAVWLLICLMSQIIYPAAYSALRHLAPRACALVLVRNLILAKWAIHLWHAARGDAKQVTARSGPLPANQ